MERWHLNSRARKWLRIDLGINQSLMLRVHCTVYDPNFHGESVGIYRKNECFRGRPTRIKINRIGHTSGINMVQVYLRPISTNDIDNSLSRG